MFENLLMDLMKVLKLITMQTNKTKPKQTKLVHQREMEEFLHETNQLPVFPTCITWRKDKVSNFQNLITALWLK